MTMLKQKLAKDLLRNFLQQGFYMHKGKVYLQTGG